MRTYHRPVITALRERRVGAGASDEPPATNRPWWLDPMASSPVAAAVRLRRRRRRSASPASLSSFYWYSDFPEALRLGDAVFHGGWGQGLPVPSQSGLGPLWLVGLLHQITGSDVAGMAFGAIMVLVAAAFMVSDGASSPRHHERGRGGCAVHRGSARGRVGGLTPVAHESTLLLAAVVAWQLVALSRPGHSDARCSRHSRWARSPGCARFRSARHPSRCGPVADLLGDHRSS